MDGLKQDHLITMAEFKGKMGADAAPRIAVQLARFRETVQYIKESLELQIEFSRYTARIMHAKYVALVEAGFTEEQALMLCR